ncbi:hypothetical protein [Stenomitos frigidus]|uniref:Uncharacterized protein n=1 Tax=Stenomitos frigidus ULC18 TaxID=2107698 RepID=A0A2T1EBS3_9CYAN|nr:hypothetical protein [Stenomitos frigidus]PSB30158.1 hypothetical protein C7B82_09385 [Stenomitos frigidus ULC18]
MSQTTIATKTVDAVILYGSTDPALNLATVRAQAMTADELYQAGFDHGFNNRGMRGSLADFPKYVRGWGEGYRARF